MLAEATPHRWHALITPSPGLCIINASGIIMACNKPLLAMWGVSGRAQVPRLAWAPSLPVATMCRIICLPHQAAFGRWNLLPTHCDPCHSLQYEKGELESKNVSCLMPQPFSGRHNGCARQPGILGSASPPPAASSWGLLCCHNLLVTKLACIEATTFAA